MARIDLACTYGLEPVRGDAFEEAQKQGHTLSLEDAIAYALGERG
jgi:hypothetical protein